MDSKEYHVKGSDDFECDACGALVNLLRCDLMISRLDEVYVYVKHDNE